MSGTVLAVLATGMLGQIAVPTEAPLFPADEFECPPGTRLEGAPPPAGTIAQEGEFAAGGHVACHTPGGRRHGPYFAWYATGIVRTEGGFNRGRKHGRWAYYHSNKMLEKEAFFDAGRPVGAVTIAHLV